MRLQPKKPNHRLIPKAKACGLLVAAVAIAFMAGIIFKLGEQGNIQISLAVSFICMLLLLLFAALAGLFVLTIDGEWE